MVEYLFRTRYRITVDYKGYYYAEYRPWCLPFWLIVDGYNKCPNKEIAREYIEDHKKKSRPNKVVEYE